MFIHCNDITQESIVNPTYYFLSVTRSIGPTKYHFNNWLDCYKQAMLFVRSKMKVNITYKGKVLFNG